MPALMTYINQTKASSSILMTLILSRVAMLNSLANELNFGGLPAVTSTYLSGMGCDSKRLFCSRSSMATDRVSDT